MNETERVVMVGFGVCRGKNDADQRTYDVLVSACDAIMPSRVTFAGEHTRLYERRERIYTSHDGRGEEVIITWKVPEGERAGFLMALREILLQCRDLTTMAFSTKTSERTR